MKKGLLLSIVASTVLFAGGDIAPVQPVADAPAAASSDFYGAAGVGAIYSKPGKKPETYRADFGAVAVLGVSKEIFSGLTLGAEVQGGTFGQVTDVAATTNYAIEFGGLTQLNLGYSFCNTAIKVGRFEIPGALSPLVSTGTDFFGLKRRTYDGAIAVNTDLADTTVWAAYVHRIVQHANTWDGFYTDPILNPTKTSSTATVAKVVAAGFQNTSFADTVITAAGYYDTSKSNYAVAGSIDTKFSDTDLSVGGAYSNGFGYKGTLATAYIAGGTITQHFGATTLKIGGTYGESSFGYAKYTDFTYHDLGSVAGTNVWAAGAALNTDWSGYKLGAWGTYAQSGAYQAGVSISKTVSGINYKVDYRYRNVAAAVTQRVRAKAVYKF